MPISPSEAPALFRNLVIEYLRTNGVQADGSYGYPAGTFNFENPHIPLPYNNGLSKADVDAIFTSTLWILVTEGIIVPGRHEYLRGSNNDSLQRWPYYTVTPY